MDTRQGRHRLGTQASVRVLIASLVALALTTTLGVTSASAASPTACRVTNAMTGIVFKALQPAVDAASDGDRLIVRGTCHGNTVIDRSLAIKGVVTPGPGKPILDGGKGHVLRITAAARVTMRGLVVQGGVAPSYIERDPTIRFLPGRGAGILNLGMLRLAGVVVRRNDASQGGGIYNSGVLRLLGASRITENNAYPLGRGAPGVAGLYNTGIATLRDASGIRGNWGTGVSNSGSLTLNDRSSISRNGWSTDYGNGGVINDGVLTMNGSSVVSDNTGTLGGGVYNRGGATLILNDSSSIRGNRATYYGGGGVSNSGTLILNDSSSIRGNRAAYGLVAISLGFFYSGGGGVDLALGGTLTLNDSSSIRGNRASFGGGVHMWSPYGDDAGTLTMTGTSRITGNTAGRSGGGVSSDPLRSTLVGVVCGPDGNVRRNGPGDCAVIPDRRATDQ
jgi:hypothetical protein